MTDPGGCHNVAEPGARREVSAGGLAEGPRGSRSPDELAQIQKVRFRPVLDLQQPGHPLHGKSFIVVPTGGLAAGRISGQPAPQIVRHDPCEVVGDRALQLHR
ncbi:MAG: hypothetical protein ACRDRY_10520 [Pseudonocardiaceae bacterium]